MNHGYQANILFTSIPKSIQLIKMVKEAHFWGLNPYHCIRINESYKKELFKGLLDRFSLYKIARLAKIDESVLREFKRRPNKKIEIDTILKLANLLTKNKLEIDLKKIENQITWIGPHTGRGISNPKFARVIGFSTDRKTCILNKIVGDKTEISTQDKRDCLESKIGEFSQREMGKREIIPIQHQK